MAKLGSAHHINVTAKRHLPAVPLQTKTTLSLLLFLSAKLHFQIQFWQEQNIHYFYRVVLNLYAFLFSTFLILWTVYNVCPHCIP